MWTRCVNQDNLTLSLVKRNLLIFSLLFILVLKRSNRLTLPKNSFIQHENDISCSYILTYYSRTMPFSFCKRQLHEVCILSISYMWYEKEREAEQFYNIIKKLNIILFCSVIPYMIVFILQYVLILEEQQKFVMW